ncbi:hypothetical protein CBR_g49287 [Chara braunii]|uniref:Inosine triphosphate pyrophosphatase n=1 Tax=Chara braunii TaxID=69332 RepID=A0A388M4M5_CHABU|nr:hypothetical protein CBR_g49287 [Chara braunii]|eukprot:GBG89496.1 hypothetical protein CBR_g49287 [Chara braunii]
MAVSAQMAAARLIGNKVPITFVTGNAKKLEEVKTILGDAFPLQSMKIDSEGTCAGRGHMSVLQCTWRSSR